jgi:hypothetical protein
MTEIFKFPKYDQHPIAISLMPGGMDDAEFTAFREDIEQRGVIMPVTLYEGKVLDGWHRYRAAQHLGISFKTIAYDGKDPAGYIASVNVLRRKLGSLQRALVGVRLHLDHGHTQRAVCKKLGISNEVVNLVLKVVQSKNAKLIKRIETDTDYTRGMLREELEDAGMLRTKPEESTPLGPNSVFNAGAASLTGAAASAGIADILAGKSDHDTDGSDHENPPIGDTTGNTGKTRADRAAKKPTDTAAMELSEAFKALMQDEKLTFLQMIWPEARALALELKLPGTNTAEVKPAPKETTPIDALVAAVKPAKKRAKKAEEVAL